ncbi:sensitivity to high expression protein she9 [Ceratobasidium sp. 370]|nr:sensitivity to high expression protein she9 [Ceratobasidium sp. 370]
MLRLVTARRSVSRLHHPRRVPISLTTTLRWATSGSAKPETGGEGKKGGEPESDRVVKEYLDSLKSSTEGAENSAVVVSDSDVSPTSTSSSSSPASAKSSSIAEPNSIPPGESSPLAEHADRAKQSLEMWKAATLTLLRSRAQDATGQLRELGGKLNKVTGYDEIEALKRRVVERERSIAALRNAAREAKDAYSAAVTTRAHPSHRRAQGTDDAVLIACRFLATDQWFRTHVDPAWSIRELKRHLLARCVGAVPLTQAAARSGPRLLAPSAQGKVTLTGLVRPPHTSAIKTSTRPSTAPHDGHPRRKPRLSLKVVPGLSKPASRTVMVHPPPPGFGFGAPLLSATGPQPPPPSSYFLPRNPLSSPELSPPRFAAPQPPDDESSPSSPNTNPHLDGTSISSRSTVPQPQSHATSPTFSSGHGTSPPSRPFSPTSLPGPVESQPFFGAADHQHLMFGDLATTSPSALRARSTPPLVRAMSTPPSSYSSKPPTPTTSRPPPSSPPATSASTSTARSPPLSSSLQSRYDMSKLEAKLTNMSLDSATSTVVDDSTLGSDSTHSPLLSVAEFLDTEEPRFDQGREAETSRDIAVRSPSPPGPGALIKSGVEMLSGAGKMRGKASREEIEPGRTAWEDEFRLVSFGIGCVLDEHMTVADSRIRPGELIEIQRTNAIIHLARPTYTQPYFEAPVYVLKRSSSHNRPHTHHNHLPSRTHQHHIQPLRDYIPPPPPPFAHASIEPLSPMDPGPSTITRMRSGTVTARDPWDTSTTSSLWDADEDREGEGWAELEMSGLEGVGGAPLGTAGSGSTAKGSSGWGDDIGPGVGMSGRDKVEWKLRWLVMREGQLALYRARAQLPAIPSHGTLPRHYISIHFTSSSGKERERDGELGLRMMDGAAHAHFLRILLRIISTPGSHTFLLTDTPHLSSAPLASQYPEWRQHVVQRAWLAGRGTAQVHMGNVAGPWMRAPWCVLTERELEMLDDSDGSAGSLASAASEGGGALYDLPEDEVGGREDESEIEWDVEGWRAWESETTGGVWGSNAWIKGLGMGFGASRPRSRSLAAPISRSASQQATPQPQPQPVETQTLLSPASTVSSELSLSSASPSTRRARSSTIAGGPGPGPGADSPGSTSPSAWSPISSTGPVSGIGASVVVGARRPLTATSTGIETVLRTSERRGSTQRSSGQRSSEAERRGSVNSLEMQRAVPSNRRAVTNPATGLGGGTTKFG